MKLAAALPDESDLWRRHPAGYGTTLAPSFYRPAKHLEFISRKIAATIQRGDGRLAISLPPRHGKSETASVWTPVWALDRWPSKRLGVFSYSENLAESFTRRGRDLVLEHRGRLRVRVSESRSAASEWETTEGSPPGSLRGVGVGGSIMGRGLDVAIIDDPYKNPEEALSPTHREKVEDWLSGVLMNRLEPGASVIFIMHRWHTQDAIGKRLAAAAEGGEPWEEVRLPALAEENDPLGRAVGEALWPPRYSREALEQKRDALFALGAHRFWWGLYQGRPLAEEGAMLQRGWFRVVDAVPSLWSKRVRYWDLAASKARGKAKTRRDFAVGTLMLRLRQDPGQRVARYCIPDVCRLRGTGGDVERAIFACAQADGPGVPIVIEREPGSTGELLEAYYRRALSGWHVTFKPSTGPKPERALPFAAQAQAGNVDLVRAPWNAAWFAEADVFPDGDNDDQIDSASGAFAEVAPLGGWDWSEVSAVLEGRRAGGDSAQRDDRDAVPAVDPSSGRLVRPVRGVQGGEFGRELDGVASRDDFETFRRGEYE